jgi:hypothetical protein
MMVLKRGRDEEGEEQVKNGEVDERGGTKRKKKGLLKITKKQEWRC